jgi:hypothetical protein
MAETNERTEARTDESNWRDIVFPRQVGQREARTFCRYLAFILEGDCYVSFHTDKHETFGERVQSVKPKTLGEVPLIPGSLHIGGTVTRTSDLSNVEFGFSHDYDRRDRIFYNGMNLSVRAFDWHELDLKTRVFVGDIRSAVQGYFEWRARETKK